MAENTAKKRGPRAWRILAPARLARAAAVALTLGAILLFLTEIPLLEHLELKTYDLRLRTLPPAPPRHVTIAAIDEKSLAALGRWPWSRSVHARLAERLDRLGARVIAYDLFFPERESARADAQFARALAATRKSLLGTLFLYGRDEARQFAAGALEQAEKGIAPHAIATVRAAAGARRAPPLQEPFGIIVSIPALQSAAAAAGHLNVLPDADGVVRRVPLVVRYGGRYYPSFDAQAARAWLGAGELALEVADYGLAALQIGGRQVPLDEAGRLLVRYRGREGSFDTVSIADVLEGRADAALVRDRVVLIGNTAKGIGDLRVTPYGTLFPGVEVRANIIENLIDGEFLQRPDWMSLVDIAVLLAIGLTLAWLLPSLGVAAGGLLALGVAAGYVLLADYLFVTEGLWLNVVYPVLLAAMLFVSTALVFYFFAFSEKRYLKRAFQHYVPPAVVEDLVADSAKLRLGGDKRELTVLFSDIRGFTALSETMAPEELVKLLNGYFTRMTERVFAHQGSLDKYIGDAIMAVFGAPVPAEQHAQLACRAALDMMAELEALQAEWRRAGVPPLDIGIGINTGPMIVGNMGSATRFNYTVLGDAVNLASRIESLNKDYGTNILLSEHTYAQAREAFSGVREIDQVRVRGRTQPVRLYELIPPARFAAMDWLEEYRAAYARMREGDAAGAAQAFEALHARTGDKASAYHARACRFPHRRQVDATS
jgi:adenylate cyclase